MRMKDKVMQVITDGVRIVDENALVRYVRLLRSGKWVGRYAGVSVCMVALGVWEVLNDQ